MAAQFEIIIPPVIVALLIILIFRVNAFIMDSSVDSRLTNEVQTHADVIADIIQEELRSANSSLILNGNADTVFENELEFIRMVYDPANGLIPLNVKIERVDNNLIIYRDTDPIDESSDNTVYGSQLSALEFTLATDKNNNVVPHTIRVKVETESNPDHHVRFRNDVQTIKAIAEREIFLRHRAMTF